MNFQKAILFSLLSVILTAVSYPMSGKPVSIKPMRTGKVRIPDGEYLRIAKYMGGEKQFETHIVNKIDEKQGLLTMYWQSTGDKNMQQLPSQYIHFSMRIDLDLKKGSLLDYQFKNFVTPERGTIDEELSVNTSTGWIDYTGILHDGEDTKVRKSRIKMKPDYPVFDMISVMMIAPRILDMQAGGLMYIVKPDLLRDTVSGTFTILGHETITTPAGTFKTVKLGFAVTDPFMAKLLSSYTRELFFWIEDSPRSLIVKMRDPYGNLVLEEISDAKKKGLE